MKYLVLCYFALMVIGDLILGVTDGSPYGQLFALWLIVGTIVWHQID